MHLSRGIILDMLTEARLITPTPRMHAKTLQAMESLQFGSSHISKYYIAGTSVLRHGRTYKL